MSKRQKTGRKLIQSTSKTMPSNQWARLRLEVLEDRRLLSVSGLLNVGSEVTRGNIEIIKEYSGENQPSPASDESSNISSDQVSVVIDEKIDLQEFQIEESTPEVCVGYPLPQTPEGEFDPSDPAVWAMIEPLTDGVIFEDPQYLEIGADSAESDGSWSEESTWYYRSDTPGDFAEEYTEFEYSDPVYSGDEWMFWTTVEDIDYSEFTREEYTYDWEGYWGEYGGEGVSPDGSKDFSFERNSEEVGDFVVCPVFFTIGDGNHLSNLGGWSLDADPVRSESSGLGSFMILNRNQAEEISQPPVGSNEIASDESLPISLESIVEISDQGEISIGRINGNENNALAIALDQQQEEKADVETTPIKQVLEPVKVGSQVEATLGDQQTNSDREDELTTRTESSTAKAEMDLGLDRLF